MCLAVPLQIHHIDGFMARCSALGIERDVNLFMMQDEVLQIGDFVIVHLGYATHKVAEEEARAAWRLFAEIMAEMGPSTP